MGDLFISVIVIMGTGVFIIFLFLFLSYRKKQARIRLIQAARERGWDLEFISDKNQSGYRLKGKSALGSWMLDSISESISSVSGPGSSNFNNNTRWYSEDIRLQDRTLVLGPALGSNQTVVNLFGGDQFLHTVMKAMLGKDAEWGADLNPIDISHLSISKRFSAMGNNIDNIDIFITPHLENEINQLPTKTQLVIIFRPSGLEIRLPNQQIRTPEEFESLIQFGYELMNSWGSLRI